MDKEYIGIASKGYEIGKHPETQLKKMPQRQLRHLIHLSYKTFPNNLAIFPVLNGHLG